MSIFNIDKKSQPLTNVLAAVKTQVQIKPGTDPEHKVRMSFRELTTVDGGRLPDVELLIDPQSVNVQKAVVQNQTQTRGGWVTQFWGHNLTTITVNATSGNYEPTYGIALELPVNARSGRDLSEWGENFLARWAKGGGPLKVFEKIKEWAYTQRHNNNEPWKGTPVIKMVWEDSVYKGYFTSFNYNLSSQSPFNIDYNFNFVVLERMDMSFSDLFGATDAKTFISDPMGTVVSKTKQLTSVGLSYAKKKAAEVASKYGNDFTRSMDIIDNLPNKITLW